MQEGVYHVTLLRLTITIFDLKISELDKIMLSFIYVWSRVSSGSIVSDYGLDDRAIGVRSPAEAEDFFL
jgi:hypothetical protein